MQLSLELHMDVIIFCSEETKGYIKKLNSKIYNFRNWKFSVTDLNQNWFKSIDNYKINKANFFGVHARKTSKRFIFNGAK